MKTLSLLPGCSSHPHKNWIIGPVGHSRDSTILEESNWDFMIASYNDYGCKAPLESWSGNGSLRMLREARKLAHSLKRGTLSQCRSAWNVPSTRSAAPRRST